MAKREASDFDEAAATRDAKRLKVAELRSAPEAAGADTKGLKAELVERLVAAARDGSAEVPPAPSSAKKTKSPTKPESAEAAPSPPPPAKSQVAGETETGRPEDRDREIRRGRLSKKRSRRPSPAADARSAFSKLRHSQNSTTAGPSS